MSGVRFTGAPDHEKSTLRRFFLQKRKILLEKNPEKKRSLDLEIQSRLLMSEEYRSASLVLCYVSRDFEIDTLGVILAALSNGKRVAAPKCEDDGSMRFYPISSLSDLKTGSFGIKEPKEGIRPLEDLSGSICICPALCCDMRGYRVGFGKGYYDRFLKTYEGSTLSLCYSDALIPAINADAYDIPVHIVVTDEFIRRNQQ
ncbi:MAG: 5-formyltetrahydrofolate cyclo-ligase [Ruminococcus sp.]|nr:5-formyltetrahydrofolate cyclo-ligase [Ruminococcus sp.]